jgi:hypothetical protein
MLESGLSSVRIFAKQPARLAARPLRPDAKLALPAESDACRRGRVVGNGPRGLLGTLVFDPGDTAFVRDGARLCGRAAEFR